MRLTIDTEVIERAISGLRKESASLLADDLQKGFSELSSFSTVSGFRNVGLRLGRISDFKTSEA